MSEIFERIGNVRGWKAVALLVVGVLLASLVVGAESLWMRLTLVGLGLVAVLAVLDLPFEDYHLFAPVSGILFFISILNYGSDGLTTSVVLPLLAGVAFGVYYIVLLIRRHDGV